MDSLINLLAAKMTENFELRARVGSKRRSCSSRSCLSTGSPRGSCRSCLDLERVRSSERDSTLALHDPTAVVSAGGASASSRHTCDRVASNVTGGRRDYGDDDGSGGIKRPDHESRSSAVDLALCSSIVPILGLDTDSREHNPSGDSRVAIPDKDEPSDKVAPMGIFVV